MPMLANLLYINILFLIKVLKFVLKFGAMIKCIYNIENWLWIIVKYFKHWMRKVGACFDVKVYEFAVGDLGIV